MPDDLDIKKENYQLLMNDIKSGDEKIKEISLILLVTGDRKEREDTIRDLKKIAKKNHIKLDLPRLRQLETWQSFDVTTISLKDYSPVVKEYNNHSLCNNDNYFYF